MLVKITDDLYVAPEQIESVKVVEGRDRVQVTMKSGEQHGRGCDYGKSIWDTQQRLVAEINAGRAAAFGGANG